MVKKKFLIAAFYIFVFILNLQVITDPDLGWHLAVGKHIFENLNIPKTDLFSFTNPNYPYVYHSWATDLSIYSGYRLFGLSAVTAFYSIILTLSVYFLIKITRFYTSNPRYYYFLALVPIIQSIAGARPRALSFLFFTLIYYFFLKFTIKNSKLIYITPLVFLLWVNFHGSFIVGLGTFFIMSASGIFFHKLKKHQAKALFLTFFASILATLINPYFLYAHRQAVQISLNSQEILKINTDWKGLISTETTGWILSLIILFFLALIYFFKLKINKLYLLLAVFFFAISLYTARFALPLLVFFTPLTILTIENLRTKIKIENKYLVPVKFSLYSLVAVICLIAAKNIIEVNFAYKSYENFSYFLKTRSPNKLEYADWPYKKSAYLVNNFSNLSILNEANWGGYLLLLNPNIKVFYYGAMDNFIVGNRSFAFDYLEIVGAKGNWQRNLEKYNVDIVFLPVNFKLVAKLRNDQNWQIVDEDEKTIIFRRR